jgi:hypothetical protein
MKFSKKDVMEFVKKALGDNATEVLIDRYTIDECDNPYDFPIYLDRDCKFPLSFCNDEDFYIDSGCSKLVIVPKNRSYVIKIPWTGVYTEVNGNGDYIGECVFDYELNYSPMEEEISYYNDVDEEARQYLAENEFVGLYNDSIPIYVQEKVKHIGWGAATNTSVSNKFSTKACVYSLGTKIAKMIVEQLGYDKGFRVVRELDSIDDLHSANYGFDKYGQFKIIDYAGFCTENYFAYNN